MKLLVHFLVVATLATPMFAHAHETGAMESASAMSGKKHDKKGKRGKKAKHMKKGKKAEKAAESAAAGSAPMEEGGEAAPAGDSM